MAGTMTNPMKRSSDFEWKIGFLMYPFVLCYLFVGYMFAQKLFSNYPDKELFFLQDPINLFCLTFPCGGDGDCRKKHL